jgi:DNA (cytosine-5)-methyltransferase 1
VKVLDLFSGIGGFTLGLDSTGFFKTVKFVEKDKYCQKVLRKNFPNILIEEDIKNVKGKEGDADVIVGGFPCQPMSVAGKRKGTDDNRYLWPEMFRLIREIKPQFVIGENVQGIINIQNGMVLRQVQDDLESEGFEVQCFLIPASGIGAWHQRYRVWIVAANTDTRLSIGENQEIQTRRDSITSSSKDVSNTNSGLRRRGTTIGESRENKVWGFYSEKEKQTRVDIRSKAVGRNVVPGGKTWWQTQSNIYGVPNGISYELDKDRANRIKALGNAIVPQIARELGLAIKKVINEDTYI